MQAASSIGCGVLHKKFRYLGVMVGECMSRHKAWDSTVDKLRSRLSKWKVKTLSIGGRLTLLKAVLGASPLYNMSIFKVPKGILNSMEALRSKFFNGMDPSTKNFTWAAWNKASCEGQQLVDLNSLMESVSLSQSLDRWICDLSGDGEFRVKEVRNFIDNLFLPSYADAMRWVKCIPIKINVFVWRARRDFLPTRVNISRRGILLESSSCPLCSSSEEDIHHVLFGCGLAESIFRRICRWWELDWQVLVSFSDWNSWFSLIRLSSKVKALLEGVFCIAWWFIWGFRNRSIYDETPPRRSMLFDDIVPLCGDDTGPPKSMRRPWYGHELRLSVVVASEGEVKHEEVAAGDLHGRLLVRPISATLFIVCAADDDIKLLVLLVKAAIDHVMSSSSTFTYTSVYTDSEPGRVFWGADEELSEGGSPQFIVYAYDGLPMQPVVLPSLDYVLGSENLPSPDYVPGPEHPPLPVEVPYVPEPEYPEYLVPFDAEAPLEDQPLPADASPTALDGDDEPFDDDDDDDTDDEDEEPFEDEDDDEEKEHLALADSFAVPIVDPVPSAGDTEAFEMDESVPTTRSPQTKAPFAQTRLCRARKTIKLEPPMSPSMEACIIEYAAAPTPPSPPPSPLSPWSSPLPKIPSPPLHVSSPPLPLPPPTIDSPTYAEASLGYRAAEIRLRASSPSTHYTLHHHIYHHDIPEAELPPYKRLCLTTPTSRNEVRESLTAAPRHTGGHRADYGFIGTMDAKTRHQRAKEVGYGIRDVWVDLTEAVEERVDGLVKDRQFHYETARLLDQEALASRDADAHSVGLSSAVSSLQGQLLAALGKIQALQDRD
ncbi:RNA-directed DNA polymerase, eukaryota [Tanacetum coccineum]